MFTETEQLKICQKRRYGSQAGAEAMIRFLVKDRRAEEGELSVYKCGTCHNWHLTSRPRNKLHSSRR